MRKSMKVIISVMVVVMLFISSMYGVYACSGESGDDGQSNYNLQQGQQSAGNIVPVLLASAKNNGKALGKVFKDVGKNFWAYDAINKLVDMGVINGFTGNVFKPNEAVTRSQFASMLTKALNLTVAGNTQTFADVPPTSWDYNVVEAAKSYLTGYRTSDGKLNFYGSRNAVREDMAVALVKALNITVEAENGQLQQVFTDYASISAELRNYVYTAYKAGLMIGSDGKFNPQGSLTRAEAATLLVRALEEVKTVVDGDGQKVVVDNGQSTAKHTDAALGSLVINGSALAGFTANNYTYGVVLPSGTTALPVVTAAVHDTGRATAVITQATALPGYALVVVTAEDGTTKLTYVINFTVAPKNTDAALSSLVINGSALAGFTANNYSYNVVLPAGTTALPVVTAAVHDTGKATAVVTQAAALPGSASLVVTAEDGTTKLTYAVNFTVAPTPRNTDATLSNLLINGLTLPGFNPGTLSYSVILPAGTTVIPAVTAAVHDAGKATAVITQAAALPGTASVVVTAEDGTTQKTYTINFTVAG